MSSWSTGALSYHCGSHSTSLQSTVLVQGLEGTGCQQHAANQPLSGGCRSRWRWGQVRVDGVDHSGSSTRHIPNPHLVSIYPRQALQSCDNKRANIHPKSPVWDHTAAGKVSTVFLFLFSQLAGPPLTHRMQWSYTGKPAL